MAVDIANFPASLQPMVQTGYLRHRFDAALQSTLAYDAAADVEEFPYREGATVTDTRKGLKAPVTTPIDSSSNTGLDNGITPSTWAIEQYTLTLNYFGDGIDLNTVTEQIGIVNQFPANAETNAIQAAQSMDRLARNALFGAYLSGNTFATEASTFTTLTVDDVRGFTVAPVNGLMQPVSSSNTLVVSVNGVPATLIGAVADANSTSIMPGGQSGTLTFSASISVASGNPVVAVNASTIVRAGNAATTPSLSNANLLTFANLQRAVAVLRNNAVPTVGGYYNCFLNATSMSQLMLDDQFQRAYIGATASNGVLRDGVLAPMMGLRFIQTTETPVEYLNGVGNVNFVAVTGKGALLKGNMQNMIGAKPVETGSHVEQIGDVVQVTKGPVDRMDQIIKQSWYWIGGYCAPTDTTTTTAIVPTSTASAYKRAVVLQHIG